MDKLKFLNRGHLKIIAFIIMMIDHFGCVFLQNDTDLYYVFRIIIGRISFPMFCVLFIEGFCYTKREKRLRHIIDLITFGLVSEIPFDYVLLKSGIVYKGAQNVMWTWLLCFLMLCLFSYIQDFDVFNNSVKLALSITLIVVFAFVSDLFKTDYGLAAPFCIGVGYLWYKYSGLHELWQVAIVVSLILFTFYGVWTYVLAVIPFLFYNHTVGCKCKYLYYLGYPVHICLFGLLYKCFL